MKNYTSNESNDLLGPGTDLIISLLGVLLMAVSIYAAKQGSLVKVKEYQKETIKIITEKFKNGQYAPIGNPQSNIYGIFIDGDTTKVPDITVHNDVTLQRISFGDHILFKSESAILKKNAANIIDKVSSVIDKIGQGIVKEINIHGHTDGTGEDHGNLVLGSERAIEVFKILTQQVSPHEFLVSASTFGEYKPTSRKEKDTNWTMSKTTKANNNREKRKKNRRTDIVLNYRENLKRKSSLEKQ